MDKKLRGWITYIFTIFMFIGVLHTKGNDPETELEIFESVPAEVIVHPHGKKVFRAVP